MALKPTIIFGPTQVISVSESFTLRGPDIPATLMADGLTDTANDVINVLRVPDDNPPGGAVFQEGSAVTLLFNNNTITINSPMTIQLSVTGNTLAAPTTVYLARQGFA